MNHLAGSNAGIPEPATKKNASDHEAVQVIRLSEMQEEHASGGVPVVEDINPLYQVKARLQVCVGEVTMTVGELLGAHEHQVLSLDRHIQQPVDLLLEGKVVARGQLVAAGEHFAVRITELPVPLKA